MDGTDKKKRFWKVPEALNSQEIFVGNKAAVKTQRGLSRVKILQVIEAEIKFKNYTLKVTQEVATLYFPEKKGKDLQLETKENNHD
ncbi:DUF5839 family protein [Lactococcus garvieae]|uniref:DUF5839 family protein n=1 Tax=Lactococcus garvieae TaxID=1363 RepID=UPI0032455473